MSLKRNTPTPPTPMAGRDIRPQVSIITFLKATSFHLPQRRRRSGYLVIRGCSNHQLSSSLYSSSSSSQHNLFHALLSQLDLLAPALGFTTALAILYKSTSTRYISRVTGYWTLFTSPTPFNRFIKLRCPSLQLEEEEEGSSNEKLVDEGGHLVNFDTGRIPHVNDYTASHVLSDKQHTYSYQRICVNTDDGGVVSLDWPANLELTKDHGLDTTILIVPGTTAGSMDENVKSFAYECLNRGCFPIVMNPRGCARSPLTTPRLFTAADSDDICTAVQFINRARPWTTLMGVGLGYGANMLTKYLAQVGEETPLTAATCLDNPFDLKEAATAGSPSYPFVDQNLTDGLIDMLQSNKELFRGRSKGFDVEKALQAKSLKDFEEAISMVSYGFDSIEEFYISSSTRDVVGNLKIPLLFIQNNAMPSSSIPHSLIAENPFTSLLMCTFQSDDRSTAVSWCRHLVIEWLTAVELALLKGRHPLLEDTDATSKRLTYQANSRSNNHMNLEQLNMNTSYPWKKTMKTSGDVEYVHSTSGIDLQMSKAKHIDTNAMLTTQTKLVVDDLELVKEGDGAIDSERGKVIQATQVAMSMLDVTMPEALSEEQKRKVLAAVGQGETLINALQDAVPEDVRGKLTTSLTTILQNQKKNSNGLSSITTPDVTLAALNTKMQNNPGQELDSNNASDLNTEVVSNCHLSKNDASEPEAHTLGNSDDSHQGLHEIPNSGTTSYDQSRSDDLSEEKAAQFHDLDTSTSTNKVERSEDHISEQVKMGHEGGTNDDQQKQNKDAQNMFTDQKSISSTSNTEETSPSSPENQLIMAKEDGENQKKAQSVPSNSSCSSPSFSVTQALDALTGMDDSTQVAVNSVFSVIEDVITQLEGNRDSESTIDDNDDDDDKNKVEGTSESESGLPQKGDGKSDMTIERIIELGNHNQQSTSPSTEKKVVATTEVVDNNDDIQHSITNLPYRNSLYNKNVQSHLLSEMKNDKLLGSDTATALYLDYVPEEDQWKLLEQSGDGRNYDDDVTSHQDININVETTLPSDVECNNDIIEPAYVILDAEGDWDPVGQYKKIGQNKGKLELGDGDASSLQLIQLVKENILKSLQFEVSRRLQAMDMVDIEPMLRKELEHVANTISRTVLHDKQHVISWGDEKLGNLQGEHMLDAASSAIQGTRYMKEVIPVGIVVDCSLASLRKIFNINAADSIGSSEAVRDEISDSQKGYRYLQADRNRVAANEIPLINKLNNSSSSSILYDEDEEKVESSSLRSDTVMVGAVTAALGASALLVQQQQHSHSDGDESYTTSSMSFNKQEKGHKQPEKPEEETSRSGDNIGTSLAEKAMLVAGPVVPTTEDGGVDQDRLVALLADLGQKGGILKLVGKVALLWGGIRGALSLIGKLISFLRLAERPLIQRILGFVFMVLVLWTPVVVPLLPTLVKNWAEHNSSKYAELACIIGLYSSIMVLVVLWGKRIRGYEDPLERYGLELTSARQILHFVCGLIGGVMLVFFIQYTNVLLGFVCLSWPPTIRSSTDAVTLLKLFGKVLKFVVQGLVTTVSVALVQELLFRSWLPEEIAVDLGYNKGVILSGLAFSLSQWSLKAIPGLWLLSLGLAGVRERCKGSLFLPIGLHAGIVASSLFLKEGGFLIYQPTNYPLWVSGGGEPFNSAVGLAVALLWAAILYPRKPQNADKREHQEGIKELRVINANETGT